MPNNLNPKPPTFNDDTVGQTDVESKSRLKSHLGLYDIK